MLNYQRVYKFNQTLHRVANLIVAPVKVEGTQRQYGQPRVHQTWIVMLTRYQKNMGI